MIPVEMTSTLFYIINPYQIIIALFNILVTEMVYMKCIYEIAKIKIYISVMEYS